MKKKIAGLNVRIQVGAVVIGLLIFGFVVRSLLVSPQGKQAAELQAQIASVDSQISIRRAQLRSSTKPAPIQTADLFKLSKAMPDREDMPGIILTISSVARQAGIKFDLIEPELDTAPPAANFRVRKMHLLFNGDFYALSDFLYRLRNLVAVRQGELDATGRLFSVQQLTFNVQQDKFPLIGAELHVNAYIYGSGVIAAPPVAAPTTDGAPATTAPTTTTPATSTTPATGAPAPAGATAAGATP